MADYIFSTRYGWWAWVGGQPAKKFKTEAEAARFMEQNARPVLPSKEIKDTARQVRYLTLRDPSIPTLEGENFHYAIVDHLCMVVFNGHARKILPRMTPSALKREPSHLLAEYRIAEACGDVLALGKGSVFEQMSNRWPE